MTTLSVLVNTKNSEQFLTACLKSVAPIADEIVIMDMASRDQTLAIAKKFTDKIYQFDHPEVGYVEPARQAAVARATGDWLLIIDSDEELPVALRQLIRQVVDGQATTVAAADAYYLARANIIFGAVVTKCGWYPDYQLRLWRRGQLKFTTKIHSVPQAIGQVAYFPANPTELAIIHHNYQTITQFVARANNYSTIEAAEQLRAPKSKKVTPHQLWQAFFGEFYQRALAQDGLLLGNQGIVLSLLQASSELQTLAKVWQQQDFPPQNLSAPQAQQLLAHFQREFNYWRADFAARHTRGLSRLYWQFRRKTML